MDKRGEKLAVGIFKALRAPEREAGWLQGRTGGLHFAITLPCHAIQKRRASLRKADFSIIRHLDISDEA